MMESFRFRTSLLLPLLLLFLELPAQEKKGFLPTGPGEKCTYSAYIEVGKVYISGSCIFLKYGNEIRASLFNEFGMSAMDFSYDGKKDKVRLHHLFKPLDRWYVRRRLRKQLRQLLHAMQEGSLTYSDPRHSTRYILKPIKPRK